MRLIGATGLAAILVAGVPPLLSAKPISLSAEQVANLSLQTQSAEPVDVAPLGSFPGTLTPTLQGRQMAAAPFAGLVQSVRVVEGDQVRAGQVLATLYSPEAVRISGDLGQSEVAYRSALASARRTRTLADEGILPVARAEEVEAQAAALGVQVRMNRQLLGGGAGGAFTLRAPISGRVSRVDLKPGEGVDAMSGGIVIDSSDALWVEVRLSASKASSVKVGDLVAIDNVETRGKVIAVGRAVDPKTRTVLLRAEVAGLADRFPGEMVNVTLLARVKEPTVALPRDAISRNGDTSQVFIAEGNRYTARAVEVVGYDGGKAYVTGLSGKDVVVTSGVSQLKALSERQG